MGETRSSGRGEKEAPGLSRRYERSCSRRERSSRASYHVAMRVAFLLCALLSTSTVSAQRPKLSSGAAAKGTSQDESLGSQLLSTVLSNDVQQVWW